MSLCSSAECRKAGPEHDQQAQARSITPTNAPGKPTGLGEAIPIPGCADAAMLQQGFPSKQVGELVTDANPEATHPTRPTFAMSLPT